MYTLTYLSDSSFQDLLKALKSNGLNGWAQTLEMNAQSGEAPTVQDWMDAKVRVRHGAALTTQIVNVDDLSKLMEQAIDAAIDKIRTRPWPRPSGESDDSAVVTNIRSLLVDLYSGTYGEPLRMRPTIDLIRRAFDDLAGRVRAEREAEAAEDRADRIAEKIERGDVDPL